MTEISNEQNKLEFTPEMEETINKVIDKISKDFDVSELNVSVLITDNENIRKINKKHRNIDSATDVLSFPMFDEEGYLDETELGDIVISLERAKSQSEEYGHGIIREIGFLTAHSMLHLLGYDHETDEEREEMFEKQDEILNELNILRDKG